MNSYGHLHTVISKEFLLKGLCTEHAYESLRHGSPPAGLFLFALRVVLPFVVYLKELGK